ADSNMAANRCGRVRIMISSQIGGPAAIVRSFQAVLFLVCQKRGERFKGREESLLILSGGAFPARPAGHPGSAAPRRASDSARAPYETGARPGPACVRPLGVFREHYKVRPG